MNDIFEGWKKERFIIAGPDLHEFANQYLIIMTDYSFWSEYFEECIKWCQDHNCEQKGMTILIPTDELLTAFCLRWG